MAHVDQHSIILSDLRRQHENIGENCLSPPAEMPQFPLRTLEEFQQFEQQIEKTDVYKYMVKLTR